MGNDKFQIKTWGQNNKLIFCSLRDATTTTENRVQKISKIKTIQLLYECIQMNENFDIKIR